MKRISALLIALLYCIAGWSQEQQMDLQQVLTLAQKQSLDAFRAKNTYLAGYWEYMSYRASFLPKVDFTTAPATYYRTMTQRYDITTNTEVFREQQTMNSYANLSLSQNIALTGGKIYLDTDFNRLVNYGGDGLTTFSVTPIRIGVSQPLFGFNELQWDKKISPVKYQKARQEYIQEQQDINLKAVTLFFHLLLASIEKDIASGNMATSDTMFHIGQRRFEIASIEKDELLDLELAKFNAGIELTQAEKELEKARFSLNSFLGLDDSYHINPILPDLPLNFQIDIDEAILQAQALNPEILSLKQQALEAEQTLDQTNKESRFNATLNASFGFNQQAEAISNAYNNLLDQEMIALSLNIPILDWGENKGERQMALNNKEVVDIKVKQDIIDFNQEVALKVIDFNLQRRLVLSAQKADAIAQESYELTTKRFILGKADVLKLNNAINARQSAKEEYINSLYSYWKYYYEVQQLTLYDFKLQKPIDEDFDRIITQ